MTGDGSHPERGSTLSLSVLALTIIAMLVLFIGTQTMSAIFSGKKTRDNSVGMAAADSAIEKYRVALEAHLADEYDGWTLDQADLERLVNDKGAGIQAGEVIHSPPSWELARGLTPTPAPNPHPFTVRERMGPSSGYSFWQIYKIVPPGRRAGKESNLTVYFRAWATGSDPNAPSPSSPRLFRAEYRPGYFSDYQAVTNETFLVESNPYYKIDGPIHSNGYSNKAGFTGTEAVGIKFDSMSTPTCTAMAEFSTARNAKIVGTGPPGASCGKNNVLHNRRARELDLLAAEKSFLWLKNEECGTEFVICRDRSSASTPYKIHLSKNGVYINGEFKKLQPTDLDSLSLTVMLDDQVQLSGVLSDTDPNRVSRVTIATRRKDTLSALPRVFLRKSSGPYATQVGALNPNEDVVSVIAQGDIVLPLKTDLVPMNSNGCLSRVNLAVISESGALTIPPQYATEASPSVKFDGGELTCAGKLTLHGSFSSNGSLLASKAWALPPTSPGCPVSVGDVAYAGVTCPIGYPLVTLRYNPVFYRNTPPAFPTSTPWATVKAKETNRTCLDDLTASGAPKCA